MPALAIEIDKDRLRDFCQRWKITEFALFGSVTRPQEFRADSDVDVFVRFADDAPWSLFDIMDVREELQAIFGRPVDLAERAGIEQSGNYLRRTEILGTAVLLDVA
ncbi:MAG TPA: nucleotidyltransferase domain-containing protein [Thermoanaerobaculia bacterium]|nr:nucleotidyltransferase domain-containing protein [Thermoanaerobaculia bacterium]